LNGELSMDEKREKEEEEQQKQNTEIETLKGNLEAEKKRSEECFARLRYMQADLENLKKRFERQIGEVRKYANEHLVTELLDVVDELEMAVKSGRASGSNDAVVQGVEVTLGKLKKVLENEGVYPIECVGQPFDPAKHNAVERIEQDDAEGCIIVEEVRKGYTMKEKVIRPSIVKVITKPSSKSQEEMTQNE
jgi:molecular chaperone GrpE